MDPTALVVLGFLSLASVIWVGRGPLPTTSPRAAATYR